MANGGSNAPPGWYPDPWYPASTRWWDGTTWTEHAAPAPGAMAPVGPVLDVAGGQEWATRAGWGFLAQAFAMGISVLLYPAIISSIVDSFSDALNETSSNEVAQPTGGLAGVPVNLLGLVSLAVLIVLCIWTSKATTNARALGRQTTHSPGMAVAAWFIPVVSLWFPYQVVRDLFPPEHPARATAKAWWWLYIGASFGGFLTLTALFFTSVGLTTVLAIAPAAMAVGSGVLGRRLALAAGEDHAQAAQALYAGRA